MNVSSPYWSPFHANNCVFSRNEQQKVYVHMSERLPPPPPPRSESHLIFPHIRIIAMSDD